MRADEAARFVPAAAVACTAALARRATVRPAFQPIVNLQTGDLVAFEALARFAIGGRSYAPDEIIPHLNAKDRLSLFVRMVEQSMAATRAAWWPSPAVFVSVNAEAGLILSDGFCDLLAHLLDKVGGRPEQLVIEMLEGERVDDHAHMAEVLNCLRKMGVHVALDDVGSGYSSLLNLRQLPVDIVKLDRCFTIDLQRKPEDLLYILMLVNLARGLGKRLVIEGVEGPEALDALTILGIEYAQGFAIGRPMAAEAVADWLASRPALGAHRTPRSLLGAFASHLTVVETCRMLQLQPLQIEWKEQARDWRSCEVGRFFETADLHDTCCGDAHRRFHEVLADYATDRPAWEQAAADFRAELARAIFKGETERERAAS